MNVPLFLAHIDSVLTHDNPTAAEADILIRFRTELRDLACSDWTKLNQREIDFLANKNKIAAVKSLRDRMGERGRAADGLREAARIVHDYMRTNGIGRPDPTDPDNVRMIF